MTGDPGNDTPELIEAIADMRALLERLEIERPKCPTCFDSGHTPGGPCHECRRKRVDYSKLTKADRNPNWRDEGMECPHAWIRGGGPCRVCKPSSAPSTEQMRREVYTRAVALYGDIEVIPGVELRDGETLEEQLANVRACAQNAAGVVGRAVSTLGDTRPSIAHAKALARLTEGYITTRFPGRRYFVEVGNDREGWIQVCTPQPAETTPA